MDREIFDCTAANITANLEVINELLSSCSIDSKIASYEEKISKFLSTDLQLINDKPTAEYYELDQVLKVFEMLESTKPETKKKTKLNNRTESFSSLVSSSSNHSCEDLSQPGENIKEVFNNMAEIRLILSSITNSNIKMMTDTGHMKDTETSNQTQFCDLVMNLRKLAKELQNIASSDVTIKEQQQQAIVVDDKFLHDLRQLNQVNCISINFAI